MIPVDNISIFKIIDVSNSMDIFSLKLKFAIEWRNSVETFNDRNHYSIKSKSHIKLSNLYQIPY